MQLASRFASRSPVLRSERPLSDDQIRAVAPSIFADAPHESRSERYSYIPTAAVLTELRKEGFQPFMVTQTRVRDEGDGVREDGWTRQRPLNTPTARQAKRAGPKLEAGPEASAERSEGTMEARQGRNPAGGSMRSTTARPAMFLGRGRPQASKIH